ncbi:GlxA family transcriptional regulator (plasmid) [Novosphingobium resinovorum]|uniref:GlxA family transcriptional regulator n=1 Tax=Novosphingobium TaxID=165696 RepID=UPI001B3C7AF4|nr:MULTISPECIES: GlxA family transcriptional regulator [Novosphingobium]MBF7015045.1 GlxA family transcriptional regulator [Novosphingobium sp. HR1a]WJM29729.1 GlxA family transcriptional regulator [Novosphingobium resinovorum]
MRKVGFVIHPGYSPITLAISTVFEIANLQDSTPVYDVVMLSAGGGPVRTSVGFEVMTTRFSGDQLDLLVVGGSMEEATPEVVEFVRRSPGFARRIAAPCIGALVLAEAGLLDGRRATTHWMYARAMAEKYPRIRVEEDRIFIADGPVWTSAGMSAGIDLALALVEEDLGLDAARQVARKMVVYHRRSGGQSQFSTLLELEPKSDRIQAVMTFARRNLTSRLSVEDLAEVAHLSPRQFSRAFQTETGQSPAKAVENLRLEAARTLMEDSSHSIDVVAQQTGFADRDRMRRAFLRAFGQPPQVIRRAARGFASADLLDA